MSLHALESKDCITQEELMDALTQERKSGEQIDPDRVMQLLHRAGMNMKGTRVALAHVLRCARLETNVNQALSGLHAKVSVWVGRSSDDIAASQEKLRLPAHTGDVDPLGVFAWAQQQTF